MRRRAHRCTKRVAGALRVEGVFGEIVEQCIQPDIVGLLFQIGAIELPK